MLAQSRTVTVPPMELDLDQFLAVIRNLDESARVEVARALAETELDAALRALIDHLAQGEASDDISDADILTEIAAVRRNNG
jgi:hypothetical protein